MVTFAEKSVLPIVTQQKLNVKDKSYTETDQTLVVEHMMNVVLDQSVNLQGNFALKSQTLMVVQ